MHPEGLESSTARQRPRALISWPAWFGELAPATSRVYYGAERPLRPSGLVGTLGCVAAAATVAVEKPLLGGSGGLVLESKIGSVTGRYRRQSRRALLLEGVLLPRAWSRPSVNCAIACFTIVNRSKQKILSARRYTPQVDDGTFQPSCPSGPNRGDECGVHPTMGWR